MPSKLERRHFHGHRRGESGGVMAQRFFRRGLQTVSGKGGAVAASSSAASEAALEVLRHGGNAVDAAVTASAVLCVTEPHMTGIGGDCFVLLSKPGQAPIGLNGAGTSALEATPAWLAGQGLGAIDPHSVHAVTVPGAIDAWDRLLTAHGTKTLGETLEPAIAIAERGYPTQPRVALDWSEHVELLQADAGGRRHYLLGGRAPAEGETMHYPALAQTLRVIAREGRDAFYEGDVAKDIVRTLKDFGSLITLDDMKATRADWVTPLSVPFEGHEIWEIPPSGQGLTVLIALNILAQFDMKSIDPHSSLRKHLEVEALKQAWTLRNRHIADPRFADVPVAELLSPAITARLASSIDRKAASDIEVHLPKSDTVYLAVVDQMGLGCSFINSIYWSFGSGLVTDKTGITLQNRGAGFSCDPQHPNVIAPRKRPLHTIIPALATHAGTLDMVFGVMGGDFQPMGHVNMVLNTYSYGLDPQASLNLPRLVPQDGWVEMEERFAPAIWRDLEKWGHKLRPAEEPLGGGQIVRRGADHTWHAGTDPRKDGFALTLS
jgi:gamma-glutamyltranspeptidase / glutathione hydrolase